MTTREQLDERYGRASHPARRRARWIILTVAAAAAVVAL